MWFSQLSRQQIWCLCPPGLRGVYFVWRWCDFSWPSEGGGWYILQIKTLVWILHPDTVTFLYLTACQHTDVCWLAWTQSLDRSGETSDLQPCPCSMFLTETPRMLKKKCQTIRVQQAWKKLLFKRLFSNFGRTHTFKNQPTARSYRRPDRQIRLRQSDQCVSDTYCKCSLQH